MRRFISTVLFVMGAFILLAPVNGQSKTWRVTASGTGDAPTIQAAVESAAPGDEIVVAPGLYTWTNQGGTDFGLLFFARGVGGFTLRSEDGPDRTFLDAQQQNRVIYIQGYNNVVIDGFTITGGGGNLTGGSVGAGICVHIAENDTIRNCVFTNNTASVGAGFWATSRCNTYLENCTFRQNHATSMGGGLGVGYSQNRVIVSGCTVINNTSDNQGGGIGLQQSTVRIENTVIARNSAVNNGGGLYAFDTESVQLNVVTICGNEASSGGGIYGNETSALTVERCIIAFNETGGGLVMAPGASVRLGCCDFFGNSDGGGWPAAVIDLGGNFSADPWICGWPGPSDFTLHSDSPCLPGLHPSGTECGLIGAKSAGCGGVPVRTITWGELKKILNN